MFTISKEQFLDILQKGSYIEFTDGKVIEPVLDMAIDPSEEKDLKNCFNALLYNEKKYEDIDELIKVLNLGEKVELLAIDNYDSFEDYLDHQDFDSISMEDLLKKYSDADRFILCINNIEEYYISEEEKNRAIEELVEIDNKGIEKLYKDNMKDKTVPLDKILTDINEECVEFEALHKNEYINEIKEFGDDFFQVSFIGDHVGEYTRYSNPIDFFWQVYETIGMQYDARKMLTKKYNGKKPLFLVIKDDVLKKNIVTSHITFNTHTTKGPLAVEFIFRLNKDTKKYLLQFENDYDIGRSGFEDLAFVKNNKVIFSSCTHEGFHFDCRKNR